MFGLIMELVMDGNRNFYKWYVDKFFCYLCYVNIFFDFVERVLKIDIICNWVVSFLLNYVLVWNLKWVSFFIE